MGWRRYLDTAFLKDRLIRLWKEERRFLWIGLGACLFVIVFARLVGFSARDVADVIFQFALLALLAGAGYFVLQRLCCMERHSKLCEQGLIVDRLIKSTELLAHEKESVRIGGIYGLWRIAVDSQNQNDKRTVLDILCSFVRASYGDTVVRFSDAGLSVSSRNGAFHSTEMADDAEVEKKEHSTRVRPDVQTVLDFLGYQLEDLQLSARYRLNLNGAMLQHARLKGANLLGAYLEEANLEGADLEGCNLKAAEMSRVRLAGAHLDGANLSEANLFLANLEGSSLFIANLERSYLAGAYLAGGNLLGAKLKGANLKKTNLAEANLSSAIFSSRKQLGTAKLHGVDLAGAVFLDECKQNTGGPAPEDQTQEA